MPFIVVIVPTSSRSGSFDALTITISIPDSVHACRPSSADPEMEVAGTGVPPSRPSFPGGQV